MAYSIANKNYIDGAIVLKVYEKSIIDESMWDLVDQLWSYMESYSKPHVIEKKNSPRAASYVSR